MICSRLKSFKSLMFQGLVAFCHPWCQVLPPEEAEFRLNVTAGSRSVAMGGHRISNNWTNDLEFSFKKKEHFNNSILEKILRIQLQSSSTSNPSPTPISRMIFVEASCHWHRHLDHSRGPGLNPSLHHSPVACHLCNAGAGQRWTAS